MDGLTKEQAIKNHREFWNWIADETYRIGRCVNKLDAVLQFNVENELVAMCWLCNYNGSICASGKECILKWPGGRCTYSDCGKTTGLYKRWHEAVADRDVYQAEKLAREIANLPEA